VVVHISDVGFVVKLYLKYKVIQIIITCLTLQKRHVWNLSSIQCTLLVASV